MGWQAGSLWTWPVLAALAFSAAHPPRTFGASRPRLFTQLVIPRQSAGRFRSGRVCPLHARPVGDSARTWLSCDPSLVCCGGFPGSFAAPPQPTVRPGWSFDLAGSVPSTPSWSVTWLEPGRGAIRVRFVSWACPARVSTSARQAPRHRRVCPTTTNRSVLRARTWPSCDPGSVRPVGNARLSIQPGSSSDFSPVRRSTPVRAGIQPRANPFPLPKPIPEPPPVGVLRRSARRGGCLLAFEDHQHHVQREHRYREWYVRWYAGRVGPLEGAVVADFALCGASLADVPA